MYNTRRAIAYIFVSFLLHVLLHDSNLYLSLMIKKERTVTQFFESASNPFYLSDSIAYRDTEWSGQESFRNDTFVLGRRSHPSPALGSWYAAESCFLDEP